MDTELSADRLAREKELDEKYPNRPHNHSPTLPFHSLFQDLFDPLNEIRKRPAGQIIARRKFGTSGPFKTSPQEAKQYTIERFIARWRKEVGDDVYPFFRLIVPEKDRERAMYGLKEKALGKLLVQILKINKDSEDGFALLNWKMPGQSAASRMAGDFAGRCYEVVSKRPMRTDVGSLTIANVNDMLDELAAAQKEETQQPILARFYHQMNATEIMWLVRIILKQMKVGATERTFFSLWHPDAENLFSVSSSLRRVCWELWNPKVRLQGDEKSIALMQCFQPQLAQFQMHTFSRMIEKMRLSEEDPTFWIEEKLDGERMQLHMMSDDSISGGKRFKFWSRKAKEYTYLYGEGFEDDNSALTRHLKTAFKVGVENIILDGEMITWDPEQDALVPFGTLKTAALSEQKNPYSTGHRPVYRIFDILYLNSQSLTRYTLRDRRKALDRSIKSVPRRFELHDYEEATSIEQVEPALRKVVAQASEGLVLKSPRSAYCLNERNDDWIKVKPEYMAEFGESLDCLVVAGYFGSGKRGGRLSSFLCGLRVDNESKSEKSERFYSFFKVGGGLTAGDYAEIRHRTDGKWHTWDPKAPPTHYVELGGGDLQYERPDQWIRPSESIVIEVKAASITTTDSFRTGLTLRFPRFKKLRLDKSWDQALSLQELHDLKSSVEDEKRDKEFRLDDERKQKRRQINTSRRKILTIAGYDVKTINHATAHHSATTHDQIKTSIFTGLSFFVASEALPPHKKTKIELEELIKAHGGQIVQTHTAVPDTLCIADRRTVRAASIQKQGLLNVIRPIWVLDCIEQARHDGALGLTELLVPLELDRHIFAPGDGMEAEMQTNTDRFGDGFARDTTVTELRQIMTRMDCGPLRPETVSQTRDDLADRGFTIGFGAVFEHTRLFFASPDPQKYVTAQTLASLTARFGGASIASDLADLEITHVVVCDTEPEFVWNLRRRLAERSGKIPRLVTLEWVGESWKEKTRLDEERFSP